MQRLVKVLSREETLEKDTDFFSSYIKNELEE